MIFLPIGLNEQVLGIWLELKDSINLKSLPSLTNI